MLRRTNGMTMGTLLLSLIAISAQATVIGPELETALRSRGVVEGVPVIVIFRTKVDIQAFRDADLRQRRLNILQALKREAEGDPATVRTMASEQGGTMIKSLWAGHALALTASHDLIRKLAALSNVESIRRDVVVRVFAERPGGQPAQPVRSGLPTLKRPRLDSNHGRPVAESRPRETVMQATPVSYASTATPEWNLAAVKGPDLWALGFKGAGVVVAGLDTGVDGAHPDLAAQYRGGANSWYDPHGEHATPADKDGHGTHAMSLAVGRANGGTAIGMAPDAQWVAVKMFNDAGFSRESVMHQSLQWVLDPDGDVSTDDAPDVVNLSWAIATVNVCNRAFQDELDLLRASGIAVVMSAGNSGPGLSTSISPANNPGQLSVGSVDSSFHLSTFSSRGPSACGGDVFPTVVAPGEHVVAADLSFGGLPLYATVAGTSFAAPHVAGAMALLRNAVPTATVADLERAITASATEIAHSSSYSTPGYGLIDTLAAYHALTSTFDQGKSEPRRDEPAGSSGP